MHYSTTLLVWVPGEPIPKQSFRYGSGRGKSRISKRVADWQETIGQYALVARQQAGGMTLFRQLMGRRVTVTVHFYRTKAGRCDIDNLMKAVLDGLKVVVFDDDQQVRCTHAYKHSLADSGEEDLYADKEVTQPGCQIAIDYWPPKDADPRADGGTTYASGAGE